MHGYQLQGATTMKGNFAAIVLIVVGAGFYAKQ